MAVEYYRAMDTGNIYGVRDYRTIFVLKSGKFEHGQWEYLTPNTSIWDMIHQEIFRNYKAPRFDPETLNHPLPELPEKPKGPEPQWGDQFQPVEPIPVSKYDKLTHYLANQNTNSVVVYVVLHEDSYESFFGDGSYFTLAKAFLDEHSANDFIQTHGDTSTYNYCISQFTLKWDDKHYFSDDFSPSTFEHYYIEGTLANLNRFIL